MTNERAGTFQLSQCSPVGFVEGRDRQVLDRRAVSRRMDVEADLRIMRLRARRRRKREQRNQRKTRTSTHGSSAFALSRYGDRRTARWRSSVYVQTGP